MYLSQVTSALPLCLVLVVLAVTSTDPTTTTHEVGEATTSETTVSASAAMSTMDASTSVEQTTTTRQQTSTSVELATTATPHTVTTTEKTVTTTVLEVVSSSSAPTAEESSASDSTSVATDSTLSSTAETTSVTADDSVTLDSADANSTVSHMSNLTTLENTTVEMNSTSSAAIDPTTSAAEATMAAVTTVCGTNVKEMDVGSLCHPSNHQSVVLGSSKCDAAQLPANEWIRLGDSDSGNDCRQIPTLTDDSLCYRPGSCNSEYPYYLSGDGSPESEANSSAKLCTTVEAKSGAAYCCEEGIDIQVMNCMNTYILYKLTSKMSATSCGKVCLAETADIPPFTLLVENEETLPLKFDSLDDKQKENLVAVELNIDNMTLFETEWVNATNALIEMVKEEVEKVQKRRTKRDEGSEGVKVEVLDGFPSVDVDNNEALYVLYVRRDDGTPVPKADVEAALAELEGDGLLDGRSGATIGETVELPKGFKVNTATAVDATAAEGNNLWMAIIIIIGVTAFIVAISFIAVWCYSFSRRGKSGAMNVSQYKEGLVGEDELNNSYKVTGGHVNVAMEDDGVVLDTNQNANGKTAADKNNIEMQQVEENAV